MLCLELSDNYLFPDILFHVIVPGLTSVHVLCGHASGLAINFAYEVCALAFERGTDHKAK